MTSDDDDRPKRKDYPRSGEQTSALDAAKSLLKMYGIPIPESFDDLPEPDFTRHVPEPPPIDRAVQMRARAASLIDRGWPQRALDVALACDESQPGIRRVESYTGEGAIVLTGDPGVGKTVAAAWWALRVHEPMTFVRAATLARTSRFDAKAWEQWMRARSLCIDDLGAEYMDAKGSFAVDLDELIDTFYAGKRPLIITTNCKASVFRQRYGARVMDRLAETGAWLNVPGQSLRRNP